MNWQTVVPIEPGRHRIRYQSEVLSMGSCFAGHLGDKLHYFQFRQVCNPFGVLFHPIPLVRLVDRALSGTAFGDSDIFEYKGLWHCLEVHSGFYGTHKSDYLNKLNLQLERLREVASRCSHMVVTLGTAWGYSHLEKGLMVANCHRLPASDFHKELSRISTIEAALRQLIRSLRSLNSGISLIFTVSPVRHLRDGLVENNRSKAHLLAAVHQIVENNEFAHYFPAYEIVMDELRDYRYYKEDMLHPTQQAVDYVWERFSDAWLDPDTLLLRKKVASVQRRLAHTPLRPESPEYREFVSLLLADIEELKTEIPWAKFPE